MSKDTIYREDAIDAIECVTWYHQNRNKDMVSGANSDDHQAWYKADDVYSALETVPAIDNEPSLVKDLVKAFCEDGTWLERQGVYTLTLAEAKQRAVDIIESVLTDGKERVDEQV